MKIGREYAYENSPKSGFQTGIVPQKTAWSPEIIANLRDGFMHGEKKEEHELNLKLCDCFITKLKETYPDSLMLPLPHEVVVKVANECRDLVMPPQK
jgi:hypothetical protein